MADPSKGKKMDNINPPLLRKLLHSFPSIAPLIHKFGVHSFISMAAAGLTYIGDGAKARCNDCQLEVSNWTKDMNPFDIHKECRPDCPFVRSMKSSSSLNTSTSPTKATTRNIATTNEQENPSKHEMIEPVNQELCRDTLYEVNALQQARRRTFSHWPNRTFPSSGRMILAGFFNCNVGDRVICIYCNLICQQWTYHDDPCQVHKLLSPDCIYVKAQLKSTLVSSINVAHENTNGTSDIRSEPASNLVELRSNNLEITASCNSAFKPLLIRRKSYDTWSNANSPPVDDLVKAGFFYSGTKTIVTCFYCNGSLQDLDANDNPLIEHVRRFPHCAYARQECGEELYRKIQESNRAQQECAITNDSTVSQKLVIPDESTLSRLVAARLDLSVSQRLLDQNFKLSVIKRCWEDQLRIKRDDFVSECDLHTACVILQKQIEHIDGKRENIVVPSVKMRQIREQNEARIHEQSYNVSTLTASVSDPSVANTATSHEPSTNESIVFQFSDEYTSIPIVEDDEPENLTLADPCAFCLTKEKKLACIPCGHMATCVACGHTLRSCPICRREIEAFVRIYI